MDDIRFEDVSLTFPNGTRALSGVSLTVRRGEFVSLVGPSGCGKSTLLRLAAGFERPTSGAVRTGGEALGYVFQDATLLPWRTVLRNVELPGQLSGAGPAERRERAMDAIRRVGLDGFEKHRPAQLSGGMRMRVSIARALTLQPKLFLFDEPFGALDEMTRERLNEEVGALFVSDPFAGLFVTHSVPESVFMSTRVVVLSGRPGRIVADIEVPFGYPRPPELRYSPEFAAVAARVSEALRSVEHEQGAESEHENPGTADDEEAAA
ncbi:ABC transporter ATP-binding protein [Spirillospora sp. NPDC047279]|uniref:ABC transporter ATP-binding protein n=1 Tax=Spirillospora sp. NPDC047279 TaxID=3155478 RepID=UPI003408D936